MTYPEKLSENKISNNCNYKLVGIKPVIDEWGLSSKMFELIYMLTDIGTVIQLHKELSESEINFLNNLVTQEDLLKFCDNKNPRQSKISTLSSFPADKGIELKF